MDNEKKNQFSEIINDINSTDLNKLEEHQKTLIDLLEKTKQAIIDHGYDQKLAAAQKKR